MPTQASSSAISRKAIAAILLLYTLTAASEAFIIRQNFGPDEPAHIIYVRSIAEHFRLPAISKTVINDESSDSTHQAHHPPLYYTAMALVYRVAQECGASHSGIRHALRLATVLFGIGWVLMSWRFASEAFAPGSAAPIAVTAFVGFLPLSTFMSAVVNNDVPEAMFFTWAAWMMLHASRTGSLSNREAIGLGVVIGLAILTKAQGLLLIPLLGIAALQSQNGAAFIRRSLIAASVAVLVSAWWFIRSFVLFGQIIPQTLVRPVFSDPSELIARFPAFIMVSKMATANLFLYFWTPNWITRHFALPSLVSTAGYSILTVLGASGVICSLLRVRSCERSTLSRPTLSFAVLTVIFLYISVLYQILFVDWYVFQQGRLILPGAAAIGVILASGTGYFIPSKLRRHLAWGAIFILPALNWAYLFLVRQFYILEG